MKKFAIICLIILGGFMLLENSFYKKANHSLAKKEVLILPLQGIPTSIDPMNMKSADAWKIAKLLSDGLISLEEANTIEPIIAKKITWSDDNKTINIELRNVNFSDNSKVTSLHAIEAIERCTEKADELGLASFKQIKGFDDFLTKKTKKLLGLEMVDEKQFRIILNERSPLILDDLRHNGCFLVKDKNNTDFLRGAIGIGPYYLDSFDKNYIKITKVEKFPFKHFGPKTIIFKSVVGIDKPADQFDFFISPEKLDLHDFSVSTYNPIASHQLILNCKTSVLKNRNLRKALYIGFNPSDLIKDGYWNEDELQSGIISYGIPGFKNRKNFGNIIDANKILEDEGYNKTHPLRLKMFIVKSDSVKDETLIWENSAFKDLHVKIEAHFAPLNEILPEVKKMNFDILRAVKFPGSTEPHKILNAFHSKSQFNFGAFRNKACDLKIDLATNEIDSDKRLLAYENVDKCLMNEFPIVPLTAFKNQYVYIRKPYKFVNKGKYQLRPYSVFDWEIEK